MKFPKTVSFRWSTSYFSYVFYFVFGFGFFTVSGESRSLIGLSSMTMVVTMLTRGMDGPFVLRALRKGRSLI